MITSDTSSGATLARSRAALIATVPSADADKSANAPLKVPTGVRAALAMTISFMVSACFGISKIWNTL